MRTSQRALLLICASAVLLATLGVHGFWIARFDNNRASAIYEGPDENIFGDFTYYVSGAVSLFELDPARKFNGSNKDPIIKKRRRITDSDFPHWARYAMIAYPYPSFKYGCSLLVALATLPFPQHIFIHAVPRMAVANLIFNLLVSAFVFVYVWYATRRVLAAVLSTLLVIFDYSNIYNSYSYMTHTTSGLMLFFAALALLMSKPKIGYVRFGVVAFLLAFCEFSSSHLFIEAAVLGLMAWGRVLLQAAGMRERIRMTIAGIIGAAITPSYIVGVETLFHFKALGLPTYFSQLAGYANMAAVLDSTYPWYGRQIWDLRLFNPLVPVIALAVLLGVIVTLFRRRLKRPASDAPTHHPRESLAVLQGILNNPIWLLALPFLTGVAASAAYSQPVSRAMTAHLVMGEVLLGILVARITSQNRVIGSAVAAVVLVCAVAGDALLGEASSVRIISLGASTPSHVLYLQEDKIVEQLTAEYNKRRQRWIIPNDRYEFINKSIPALLAKIDQNWSKYYPHLPKADYAHAWLGFNSIELVTTYASTRRFWRQLIPFKANLVTPKTYESDFRLIGALFALANQGKLGAHGFRRITKWVWPFSLWVQEYDYTLGYLGGVRPYLAGTSFQNIDMHSVYYFNLLAVRDAINSRHGPGSLGNAAPLAGQAGYSGYNLLGQHARVHSTPRRGARNARSAVALEQVSSRIWRERAR